MCIILYHFLHCARCRFIDRLLVYVCACVVAVCLLSVFPSKHRLGHP